MAFIYAMSDMHGDMEAYERALSVVDLDTPDNLLVLCGDYMAPPDGDFTMIHAIMELQQRYPQQVIALAGNHEYRFVEEHRFTDYEDDPAFAWMRALPLYFETPTQIFVHAGVDEEAEDLWKVGTEDSFFCEKIPATTGSFLKDIIAGHVGTYALARDDSFHDVFWDGASHYYIDGTVQRSHHVPVLKYDTEKKRYTSFRYDNEGCPYEDGLEDMGIFDDDGTY